MIRERLAPETEEDCAYLLNLSHEWLVNESDEQQSQRVGVICNYPAQKVHNITPENKDSRFFKSGNVLISQRQVTALFQLQKQFRSI